MKGWFKYSQSVYIYETDVFSQTHVIGNFFMEHPDINDTVFLEADGVGHNYASINRGKGIRNESGMFFIIEGYREASFYLLDELIKNHNQDWLKIDSIIYPVLFSFRHYLEVVMKDTLRYHRMIKKRQIQTKLVLKMNIP